MSIERTRNVQKYTEEQIRAVFDLTAKGHSSGIIATKLTESGQPMRDAQVVGIWTKLGGKEAFQREIARRIMEGEPLVAPKPKPVEVLSNDELLALWCLLRTHTLTQALARMHKRLTEGQVRHFIRRKYPGGMVEFHETCARIHAERRGR